MTHTFFLIMEHKPNGGKIILSVPKTYQNITMKQVFNVIQPEREPNLASRVLYPYNYCTTYYCTTNPSTQTDFYLQLGLRVS